MNKQTWPLLFGSSDPLGYNGGMGDADSTLVLVKWLGRGCQKGGVEQGTERIWCDWRMDVEQENGPRWGWGRKQRSDHEGSLSFVQESFILREMKSIHRILIRGRMWPKLHAQWSLWLLCEEQIEWGWGRRARPEATRSTSRKWLQWCMRDGHGLDQNNGSQGPGKWVDSRDVYRVESIDSMRLKSRGEGVKNYEEKSSMCNRNG